MKIIFVFIMLLSLTGCYTVVWLPSEKFPDSYHHNEFYDSEYYGEYYDYYSIPWWILNPINIYYPSQNLSEKNQRDKNTTNVRNETGERNFNDRTIITRNEYIPPITTTSGDNNSNAQNNNGVNTTTSNDEHSRSNSNSNSNSNTNSKSLRNENGNRNSEDSRR